ncbi:hypothetical protein [Algoriphagus persicinus]|uniref:hypothetical protein n=1 Tax=Algoriphagus persicinus TaxID=3108754 RepID=UPI002B3E0E2E|nr:hypothetical protein [Algoriphagus sp. E1-3-M2]MEB2786131.1 hypothetical protein [Algoriphagus sp. E1-3-M2]
MSFLPKITLLFLFIFTSLGVAQGQRTPDDSKGFVAHDPVMIKQDSSYYLFVTGQK